MEKTQGQDGGGQQGVKELHDARSATQLPRAASRAFNGEPSARSERPERKRGRRVRCKDEMDSSRDMSGIVVPMSYGVICTTTERRSP